MKLYADYDRTKIVELVAVWWLSFKSLQFALLVLTEVGWHKERRAEVVLMGKGSGKSGHCLNRAQN